MGNVYSPSGHEKKKKKSYGRSSNEKHTL